MKRNFAGKLMALIAVCALMATMLVPTIVFADETYGKPMLETVFASDDLTKWSTSGSPSYTNNSDGSVKMGGYGDAYPRSTAKKAVGISYTLINSENLSDNDLASSVGNFHVQFRDPNYEDAFVMASVHKHDDNVVLQLTGGKNASNVDFSATDSGATVFAWSSEKVTSEVKNVQVDYVNGVIYASGTTMNDEPFNAVNDISAWFGKDSAVKVGFRTWCGWGNVGSLSFKNVKVRGINDFEKTESRKNIFMDDFSDSSKWTSNSDENELETDVNGGLFKSGSVFYTPSYDGYYDNFVADITLFDALGGKCLDETVYISFQPEDTAKSNVNMRLKGDGKMEMWLQSKNEYPTAENFNLYGKTDDTLRLIFKYSYGVLTVSAVCDDEIITSDPVSSANIFDATTKYTLNIYSAGNDGINRKVYIKNIEVYQPLGVSVDDVKLEVKTAESTYAPTAYIAGGADYKVTIAATGTDGKLIGALYGKGQLMNVIPMDVTASTEFNFTIPQGTENPVIKFFRWKNINGDLAPYLEPITFTAQP